MVDKVLEYLQLVELQIKPHSDAEEDILVEQLDALWHSMNEAETAQARAGVKALLK